MDGGGGGFVLGLRSSTGDSGTCSFYGNSMALI